MVLLGSDLRGRSHFVSKAHCAARRNHGLHGEKCREAGEKSDEHVGGVGVSAAAERAAPQREPQGPAARRSNPPSSYS